MDTEKLELRREVGSLKHTVAAKDRQLVAQQVTIDGLNEQLKTVRAIEPQDLDFIFHPVKIEIDSLSGGADYDGEPGDDGVTVYLRPVDRDGDFLKAAGDIRIELFDLSAAPEQALIGRWDFDAAQVNKLWYGDVWTYHYTIKCPWPGDPPAGREITIRARFTDYLTQSVMAAQATCEIEPRP